MLDFSRLQTPRGHAGILIEPAPNRWIQAARSNFEALRLADTPILDSTLGKCRVETRKSIVGTDDKLVIVTGHQPAFIHPGVWAKHIVASRLAAEVKGVAVNLVVDSDAIKRTTIDVPAGADQGVEVKRIPVATGSTGSPYEQLRARSQKQISEFENEVRDAIGARYESTAMPLFFEGLASAGGGVDWVDQMVAGRRAVETEYGVQLQEYRVSAMWCTPLLPEIMTNASRFAESYNAALGDYRKANRIRGEGRPIPNLNVAGDRCETPLWAIHSEHSRHRLFVQRSGGFLRLFAGDTDIGRVPLRDLESCKQLRKALGELGSWSLRPRALLLTIWARLLLADLFIHGIGGAKYDRISDSIIADYYGLKPPSMVCASATLHLNRADFAPPETVRLMRRDLRDFHFNPQRHLPIDPGSSALRTRREVAVRRSNELRTTTPREHEERRLAFAEIRECSASLLALGAEAFSAKRGELTEAINEQSRADIARGREYFFALYDRTSLQELMRALPDGAGFRL